MSFDYEYKGKHWSDYEEDDEDLENDDQDEEEYSDDEED